MSTNNSIAIVGMASKFPNSNTTDEFWKQLNTSKDAIKEIPKDRWNINDYYSSDKTIVGKTYSKHGGFIDNIYDFDPLFFRLSRSEVVFMDPQQRLMLETSWRAFENACIKPSSLKGMSASVFVAASTFDYAGLSTQRLKNLTYYSGIGTNLSIIANRLSYIYNLDGPSLTVDTACSSSLVALHLACKSLQSGESNLALVGGVNALLSPVPFIGFSKANVLDETGHCKPFDADANGFIRGEGCGVVLLKRLSDAEKDGNQILATIDGTAINQDGMSNGISAPNGIAQQKVIRAAWQDANITSKDISFIEAHGTATPLGDPIELNSINKVLEDKSNSCYIGSAKSSIGHLEAAAGMAALIKVLLCIKNDSIPAQYNFNTLNPNIKLTSKHIKIPTTKAEWSSETFDNRVAGINSFGFGGTNAHVVVSAYTKNKDALVSVSNMKERPYIIILSAKKNDSLLNMTKSVLNYMNDHKTTLQLENVAYTLQMGREYYFNRIAIVAHSITSLIELLETFIAGKTDKNIIIGKANRKRKDKDTEYNTPIDNTKKESHLNIAKSWVSGDAVDWTIFYEKSISFLHDFPGYEFNKETFRFSSEDLYTHFALPERLHPLIHKNKSTLEGVKFITKLSGNESFMKDHQIDNKYILPGAAFIEIAKSLGKLLLQKDIVSIKNLVFIEPFTLPQALKGFEVNVKKSTKENIISFNITAPILDNQKSIFARGKFEITNNQVLKDEDHIDLELLQNSLNSTIEGSELYDLFEKNHFKYGPSHRTINKMWYSDEHILVRLKQQKREYDFDIDIGLMDGVFQAASITEIKNPNGFFVPFAIKNILLYDKLPNNICAKLTIDKRKSTDNKKIVDVLITNDKGYVIAKLEELTFQRINFNN